MDPSDAPPSFDPINLVNLVSADHSKISHVSLYSSRAEITRLYNFSVATGQNQVNITGLPNVLDQESLRVEGRGAATIHEVTVSRTPPPPVVSTSLILAELLIKKERIQKSLERSKKSITSLETYLSTLNLQHVDHTQIANVLERYDFEGEKLDIKVLELEKELETIEGEIKDEKIKLEGLGGDDKLGLLAAISVFAESAGQVEIALIYAVRAASWVAGYDIRVNMRTKDAPVTLIYKAAITQNTGESWDDVPLTLETATPTFGVGVPHLNPWHLSIYKPSQVRHRAGSFYQPAPAPAFGGVDGAGPWKSKRQDFRVLRKAESMDNIRYEHDGMVHREVEVSSQGSVSATFRVPGMISIPSDGQAHNVTIVQLKLDASMSWVSVPKEDAKTHLKAKIKNASDYTLLNGNASVYVDGSFISRSNVPPVSPQESFDCPLGLDSSIRITYHPLSKKVSQSGFYQKTSNHIFSQRITIFNTKATAIEQLKVIDQIPVSEDSSITVKLNSPTLNVPLATTSKSSTNIPPPVTVSNGVVAQWDGTDEPGFDVEALGKDGKLNWLCSVPSQAKINLLLQWEVTAPTNAHVVGL